MSIWNHLLCRARMAHTKCRVTDKPYLRSDVYRCAVPDDKVKWSVDFPDYKPPDYTDPKTNGKEWADPEPTKGKFKWNAVDGKVNRESFVWKAGEFINAATCLRLNSHKIFSVYGKRVSAEYRASASAFDLLMKEKFKCKLPPNTVLKSADWIALKDEYSFDKDSRPVNPIGRTGLRGRGALGRWGPNHAADPLVTRIKDGKLQFVAIERGDTGEWAIPGGMVDAGEVVSETLKREFSEETMGGKVEAQMEELWKEGVEIYKGYVDDPRNTDNAWMETTCMNFHDTKGFLDKVELKAGSDASNVRWIDADANEPLYASHEHFIELLKEHHKNKKN